MEWIKADHTDRLPGKDRKVIRRVLGDNESLSFGHVLLPNPKVEWLDESPNESTQAVKKEDRWLENLQASEAMGEPNQDNLQAVKELWDALDLLSKDWSACDILSQGTYSFIKAKAILTKYKP